MSKQKRTWDVILVVVMVLLCLLWIYPIVLILLNSLKTEGSFTTSTVFRLPTAETFAGLRNYVYGVTKMNFLSSMGYSLLITVTSVVLILLCCSMTGWYLTRVNNKLSKFMNLLIASIRRLMTNDFHIRREDASKYPACVFIEPVPPENASESSAAYAACVLSDGGRAADEALQDEARWTGAEWRMSNVFEATLDENPDIVDELSDLADFVLARWARLYGATYRETRFSLYQTYTYEEVCRLLDWERNVNAQNIGGYFYDRTTKTMPVFVNYEKEEGAIAYADRFLSERRFVALSKRNRRPTSSDADHIFKRGAGEAQNRIYLFVRRNKKEKEAKAFYFLGEVRAAGEPISVEVPGANGVDPAFEIDYRLAEPVRSDIYAYLTA